MKKKLLVGLLALFCMTKSVYAAGGDYDGGDIKTLIDFIDYYYAGDEVEKDELYEAAIRAVFEKLDRYSVFYNEEEYKNFITAVSGEMAGIGVYIEEHEQGVKVLEPIEGSPAEKAGLLSGDIIIEVDGKIVKDIGYKEGVNAIKGEVGTSTVLTIKRGAQTLTKEVMRDLIKTKAISYKPLLELYPDETNKDAKDVWYVDIDSFDADVADEFNKVVTAAEEQKVKGLIIDLRNNGGGYLDQVVKMCQRIVPEGPILSTRDKNGGFGFYWSDSEGSELKLVLLTNENTASASEIFSSAIKESRAGILVGETTFGKGVVQRIIKLEENLRFKLTMSEYFSRDGNKINGIGVEPDLEVVIPSYLEDTNKTFLFESDDEYVKNIKEILYYLGYLEENNDSTMYDAKTVSAIMAYQEDKGLLSNGVCDYFTLVSLNMSLAESVQSFDPQMNKAMQVIYGMIP